MSEKTNPAPFDVEIARKLVEQIDDDAINNRSFMSEEKLKLCEWLLAACDEIEQLRAVLDMHRKELAICAKELADATATPIKGEWKR